MSAELQLIVFLRRLILSTNLVGDTANSETVALTVADGRADVRSIEPEVAGVGGGVGR